MTEDSSRNATANMDNVNADFIDTAPENCRQINHATAYQKQQSLRDPNAAAVLVEALVVRLGELKEHCHQAEREGLFQTQADLTGLLDFLRLE